MNYLQLYQTVLKCFEEGVLRNKKVWLLSLLEIHNASFLCCFFFKPAVLIPA